MSLKLYTVTVDLVGSGDYQSLKERLRSLGGTQVITHQWALRTTHTATELKDILREFIDFKDRIVVSEVGAECASRRAMADLGKL